MIRIAGFYLMRRKEFAEMVNYRVGKALNEFIDATMVMDLEQGNVDLKIGADVKSIKDTALKISNKGRRIRKKCSPHTRG